MFLHLAPADVWELIFQEATRPPSVPTSWLSEKRAADDYRSHCQATVRTQLAIQLICKASGRIGKRFLFTHIHLFRQTQLQPLLACLEQSNEPWGIWTRELHSDFNLWRDSLTDGFSVVGRLFEHFPRLRVLANPHDSVLPVPYRNRNNLKSVVCDSILDVVTLGRILACCSVLTCLSLTYLSCPSPTCTILNKGMLLFSADSLSTLHIYVLHRTDNFLCLPHTLIRMAFPALRHVTLSNGLCSGFPFIPATEFLLIYGQQLTSFDWRDPYAVVPPTFILDLCPNLTRIDYNIHGTQVPDPTSMPINLREIGFHGTRVAMSHVNCSRDALDEQVDHVSRHIYALTRFPALRYLLILDQTAEDILYGNTSSAVRCAKIGSDRNRKPRHTASQVSMWWRRWFEVLQQDGKEVMDMSGQVINVGNLRLASYEKR